MRYLMDWNLKHSTKEKQKTLKLWKWEETRTQTTAKSRRNRTVDETFDGKVGNNR